ncbi:alpha/beta hydrolase [Terracoccus luteus]|jgi:uncharacterized membrane protein|uniref:Putative membrane protein n=1 Tax=Terracoccus luteus TaxID=53356 RepID=A0A839Q1A9_9MICO|nr:alpha/beta-hydrolase family protein [Terracoccus luteus]MBB2988046.1 putative membrane protein [Terracoccus luteus]MCP2173697.1 putative membrane protein [Terracoccus luteus]
MTAVPTLPAHSTEVLLRRRTPWWHLSRSGLFFAAAYVLISMSPSLLPRTWYFQGLITGLCAAAGYGVGVLLGWLSRRAARAVGLHVFVSEQAGHVLRIVGPTLVAAGVVLVTVSNVRSQARTASVVRLTPLSPLDWVLALGLAAVIAVAFLLVARGLRGLTRRLAVAVGRVLPRTIASVVAVVVVATGTAWVSDSVLFRRGMQLMAAAASQVNDETTGRPAPTSSLRSGGPGSLVGYDSLGYQGQMFVTSAPTTAQLTAATGRAATEPIRVYAGRPDDEDIAQVAGQVVAELRRTGAFDRKVLAVVTSTGTGWVDDYSVQAIEYLSDGDSAVASMQYSFLPSALAVITDRQTPREAGAALFDAVYAEWSRRPADSRPRLVVAGESLGSYGAQAAFTDVDDMMAKAQGGVFVGTPSFSPMHERLTESRVPGSPEIAPVVDDGQHVRFATRGSQLLTDYYGRPYGDWEFPRFVYAQHPSDPVVWWNPALLGSQPDWLREPRGSDVNPDVTWIPFATFWQVTTDMAVGHDPSDGFGHRYGAELVPEWAAVLGLPLDADLSRIVDGVEKTVNRVA